MNDNEEINPIVNAIFIFIMLVIFVVSMLCINSCVNKNSNENSNYVESNDNIREEVKDTSNKVSNVVSNPTSNKKNNTTSNKVGNTASNKKSNTNSNKINNTNSNKISNTNSNKISNNTSNKTSNNISNSNATSNSNKVTNRYTVTLVANGASISKNSISCTTTGKSCSVTLPSIARSGFTIVGWNTDKDSTSALYKVNSKITLTKNVTLYAITKKMFTLTIYDNDTTSAKVYKKLTCNIYNEKKYCKVILPEYNVPGIYNNTYGTKVNYNFNSIMAGKEITLTSDTNYYMIYHNFGSASNTKIKKFDVCGYYSIPVKGATFYLDCEKGVNSSNCKKYYNLYKSIVNSSDNTKNLLVPHKAFLFTNSTYETYSKSTNGLTSYNSQYGFVILRYYNETDAYRFRTAIHEAFHAWDGYSASIYGERFTDTDEAKKFLDSLPASQVGEKPNVHEWWAYFYADYYAIHLGKFKKLGISGTDSLTPLGAYNNLSAVNRKKAINILAKYGIANKVS